MKNVEEKSNKKKMKNEHVKEEMHKIICGILGIYEIEI